MIQQNALTQDHLALTNVAASRAYFKALMGAVHHLPDVLDSEIKIGTLRAEDVPTIGRHLKEAETGLSALSRKYAVSPRLDGPLKEGVMIDAHDSGFPTWQEISAMAIDASTAAKDLEGLPAADRLRSEMLREIMTQAQVPTRLQNLMARRQYLEKLVSGDFMTTRSAPEARLVPESRHNPDRRHWRVDWAVYDSACNLMVIYMMDLGDTGRVPMTEDPSVWPVLSHHLTAQSLTTLSLDTIAKGVDRDFSRLHPTELRRLIVGPFYAPRFTQQDGPINKALTMAGDEAWALVSTLEKVRSESETVEGFFARQRIQTYAEGTSQKILLSPNRVFQAIQDQDQSNRAFRAAHKHIIGDDGALHARF